MGELKVMRDELDKITKELFKIIQNRKVSVQQIQLSKEKTSAFKSFDPIREYSLFQNYKIELQSMSLKELFSFSLLIEDHAEISTGDYPQWSNLEHISSINKDFTQLQNQVNPILLAVTHKDLYDSLKLSKEFQTLLNLEI